MKSQTQKYVNYNKINIKQKQHKITPTNQKIKQG